MNNSKFVLVIIFFFLGIFIGGVVVIFAMQQSVRTLNDADEQLGLGNLPQALQSYELAQKQWPLLYYDKRLNTKIKEIRELLAKYQDGPIITIFFKDKTPKNEIENFSQRIQKIEGVETLVFISKEEAFEYYLKQMEDHPEFTNLVSSGIFTDSLEVHLENVSIKDEVKNVAKKSEIVEEVIETPNYNIPE